MWPKLTNIDDKIYKRILEKSQPIVASNLNSWIRVFSGAVVGGKSGLIIASNNIYDLFRAAGQATATIYGTDNTNGAIGLSWDKKIVGGGADRGYRPIPIITGFDVAEGTDQISREGNIQIKCFSLYQLEYLQKYFMEPGYSLCIEWGWNTVGAGKNLINDKGGIDSILSAATDTNLDTDSLHKKRVSSSGDYDTYLGFIVGCTVKSEGENFILDVKMKGSPSLPTFMQSHTKVQKTDSNGKIIEAESVDPFGPSELVDGGSEVESSGPRRYKKLFNELPAERQLKEIKDRASSAIYYDFVGFDEYVQEQINDFHDGGEWWRAGDGGEEISIEGVEVKKDSLFSDKKFIRMGELVNILNINGALESIKMGNKELTFKINIDNTVIGAFPNMFSTNSSKLIIPGNIPDFSAYYLSTAKVIQGDDGILSVGDTTYSPIDTSLDFGGIRFVQNTELNSNGLKEKAGYWGYLKNLYVNFDVFKTALESKNKTVREVFTDILNECSSAVNSFWNFQIKDETIGNQVVLTVFDENWIGSKPDEVPPVTFYHSGYNSPFLEANLDMSIPANMVSQIVTRRLSYATNPDEPITGMGSFFSSEKDLFMKKIESASGTETQTQNTQQDPPPPTDIEQTEKEIANIQAQQDRIAAESAALNINPFDVGAVQAGINLARVTALKLEQAALEVAQQFYRDRLAVQKSQEIAKQKEAEQAAKTANLTSNLEKLTILPKPKQKSIGTLSNDSVSKKENAIALFGFYTFNDGGYFDRLRNNAYAATKNSGKLSHPLPIKYSFTILGTSGIRRGDTFNIIGIPSIYRNKGLFQVINVSQQLEGMNWTTNVEGQYRQKE